MLVSLFVFFFIVRISFEFTELAFRAVADNLGGGWLDGAQIFDKLLGCFDLRQNYVVACALGAADDNVAVIVVNGSPEDDLLEPMRTVIGNCVLRRGKLLCNGDNCGKRTSINGFFRYFPVGGVA